MPLARRTGNDVEPVARRRTRGSDAGSPRWAAWLSRRRRPASACRLEVDAGTLTALTGAGFGVTPALPATATGSTFSFPITKGRVHLAKGKKKKNSGYINHSGGITFTKGAVSATASDLRSCSPRARRCASSRRSAARTRRLLDLKNLAVADGKITADALLAKQGGDALNAAFGVTLFTPGLAMGKVTVTPGS